MYNVQATAEQMSPCGTDRASLTTWAAFVLVFLYLCVFLFVYLCIRVLVYKCYHVSQSVPLWQHELHCSPAEWLVGWTRITSRASVWAGHREHEGACICICVFVCIFYLCIIVQLLPTALQSGWLVGHEVSPAVRGFEPAIESTREPSDRSGPHSRPQSSYNTRATPLFNPPITLVLHHFATGHHTVPLLNYIFKM